MNSELGKYVVEAFGLDPKVVDMMNRCTNVLSTLDEADGLQRLMDLSDDVSSPSLVLDTGVAYLLNAVSWMKTHPDVWPLIWRKVCDTRVGSSLPSPILRKITRLEHIHRLRLLEEKFPVVERSLDFPEITEAIREVSCSIAIRIKEDDLWVRVWKATIACYLIACEVGETAAEFDAALVSCGCQLVGFRVPLVVTVMTPIWYTLPPSPPWTVMAATCTQLLRNLRACGLMDFLCQQLRVSEHDLVAATRFADTTGCPEAGSELFTPR